MRVLIVVAHPDDEVLGCGGTIARLVKEGHDVYIAILGEGITSRSREREQTDFTLIKTLQTQSNQVAKMLGVKDIFMYNLPDNRFDTVPLLDVIKIIEDLIARVTPEIIYTHHGSDLNIDHQIVNRAVLTGTRPMQNGTVKELYAFEVPSSTEWAFQSLGLSFYPNVFVNISDTLDIKIKALSCYKSEVRVFPHPRSPESIKAIACRWGSVVGYEAAEVFELIRSIR